MKFPEGNFTLLGVFVLIVLLALSGCVTPLEPGLVCYEESYKITCVRPDIVPTIEVPEY